LGLALGAPHVAVALDPAGAVVRAWPGVGTSLALLGVLLAALAGADGIPHVLTRHQFGWRHISAGLLTALAAASALLAAGAWVVTTRADIAEFQALAPALEEYTPAVARELAGSQERARTLALTVDSDGAVTASLWRGDGPQLHLTSTAAEARVITDPLAFVVSPTGGAGFTGDGGSAGDTTTNDAATSAAAAPEAAASGPAAPDAAASAAAAPDAAAAELGALTAQLSMGVARTAGDGLAAHGVGVVLVPPSADPGADMRRGELVAALDATPGLARVGETESGVVWRVSTDEREGAAASIHRLTVREPDGRVSASLPAEPIGARVTIPEGASNRLLVLTERVDEGWQLEVDGARAVPAQRGWQQAFLLPPGGGEAALSYAPPGRPFWITAQVIVLGAAALLAVPVRRRQEVE
nr:hypothetical protein [Actinomycetales bacterium]